MDKRERGAAWHWFGFKTCSNHTQFLIKVQELSVLHFLLERSLLFSRSFCCHALPTLSLQYEGHDQLISMSSVYRHHIERDIFFSAYLDITRGPIKDLYISVDCINRASTMVRHIIIIITKYGKHTRVPSIVPPLPSATVETSPKTQMASVQQKQVSILQYGFWILDFELLYV